MVVLLLALSLSGAIAQSKGIFNAMLRFDYGLRPPLSEEIIYNLNIPLSSPQQYDDPLPAPGQRR